MAYARRSLGDALAMTPDKLAFIQGAGTQGETKVKPKVVESKAQVDEIQTPIALGFLGVCPRFAWNDLLALMTTQLRGAWHPTFSLWPRRSQVV